MPRKDKLPKARTKEHLTPRSDSEGGGECPEFEGAAESARAIFGWEALRAEAQFALQSGPPFATLNDAEIAQAYLRYLQGLATRAQGVAREAGVDLSRVYKIGSERFSADFSIPTFEEVESRYRKNIAFLVALGALAPSWGTPAMGSGAIPMASFAVSGAGVAGFLLPWWLAKLLSLFGIEEEDLLAVGETFVEEMGEELFERIKDLLRRAGVAGAQGKWDEAVKLAKEALDLLQEVLNKLIRDLDGFVKKLAKKWAKKLGAAAARRKAAKIAAKIASKFVPILGWFLLLLELICLIIKNIKDALI